MFHSILIRELRKYRFSSDWGSWSKSVTAITERSANSFSGIVIIISPNLEWIYVHKSLYTIECSSIINNFTSDSLFLNAALDLSLKPSNFVPSLVSRPEWIVVLPIFAADIPVGPGKRTLDSQGPYNDKVMFLILRCITLSPNEFYASLHCLREICALVPHLGRYISQSF